MTGHEFMKIYFREIRRIIKFQDSSGDENFNKIQTLETRRKIFLWQLAEKPFCAVIYKYTFFIFQEEFNFETTKNLFIN